MRQISEVLRLAAQQACHSVHEGPSLSRACRSANFDSLRVPTYDWPRHATSNQARVSHADLRRRGGDGHAAPARGMYNNGDHTAGLRYGGAVSHERRACLGQLLAS
jgi:hypothetical protein